MLEYRQDPLTKEWVIISTERGIRPNDFTFPDEPKTDPAKCPFCPGNEDMTPDTILSKYKDGKWQLRVVPNKFAVVKPENDVGRIVEGLNRKIPGYGFHEVVIETRDHSRQPALMNVDEVTDIVEVYFKRYNELLKEPGIELVTVFRNHGRSAGTSLVHPHSQIVATPIIPYYLRHKILQTMNYYDDTGHCIFCDIIRQETELQERIISENDEFLVFAPFAAKRPYELLIIPKRHKASFGKTNRQERQSLGRVLRDTLKRMYLALKNPDYNLIIHSAPYQEDPADYYHWRIRIVPRLSKQAGFEISGPDGLM